MVNRVGGLASGMDIDALVKKLMTAEKVPLNKLYQKKQTYEWQRDAYRSVNTKLKTFDTYVADNLVLKNLITKTANSSNTNLISATASGKASGTISIESVSQLASAARIVGNEVTVGGSKADGSTKMSELGATGTIEFKAIQSNGQLASEATPIEITSDMTVNDFISKVNNSNAGINAVFENGRFSFTAKNTGHIEGEEDIQVVADKTILDNLKLSNLDTDQKVAGKNAKFTVNGIETERTTNNISINGYNVTLKDTFTSTQAVTLSSTTNVDDMMNKIKEFVTTYNGLVKDFTDQTKETKYRDYTPLTSEQKEEMSENEIKLWEEKAKSGLLRGDSLIREGLSSMRSLVYQTNPGIDSKYNSLYSIGITTTKNYNDGGALEIDEVKLRKVLEEDPDAVDKLFKNSEGKEQDTVNGQTVDTRGYLQKLRSSMKTLEINIEKKAGRSTMTDSQYTLGKNLIDTESRIGTWKSKLETIEARYWKQFTAMETAINKANSQSSLFSQG